MRSIRDPGLERSARLGVLGTADFGVYALLGAAVGLAVAVLEWFAVEVVLHAVLEAGLLVQAVLPVVGLVIATMIVARVRDATTSTSDTYIRAFHTDERLSLPSLAPTLAASSSTIGLGGALGFEGPAVLLGSTFGEVMARRLKRFSGLSHRALLAAGAAAGVAAVFKAPATGVLFALESPYKRDLARHALIPTLVASSASYLVFVLLLGQERLLRIGPADLSLRHEVGGAIVVGLLGGLAARLTASVFQWAKYAPQRHSATRRIPVVGALLIACVVAANALIELPATLGPGAEMAVEVVLDAELSVWIIIALFGLRVVATSATLAGGGVGGVFIPLVVQGLLLGSIAERVLDAPANGLYPVIGLAAVLGAGYRTPLAAVTFVAETTGRAEFVIPALLATAVSQALMGDRSVSSGQLDERKGRLEQRLGRPAAQVMVADVGILGPNDLLSDVIDELNPELQTPAIPVLDGTTCKMLVLNDIASALFDHGDAATVGDVMRTVPSVGADSPAMEAARIMNTYNCAAIAVVDADGRPHGVVTAESLAGLRDIDELEDDLD